MLHFLKEAADVLATVAEVVAVGLATVVVVGVVAIVVLCIMAANAQESGNNWFR